MKNQSYLKLIFTGLLIFCLVYSCEKDDNFHQVSALENNVVEKVNEHRVNEGLEPLVHQFLMDEEAHLLSKKMANGLIEVGGTEINEKLTEMTTNLGGNQSAWLAYTCAYANADSFSMWFISTNHRLILWKNNSHNLESGYMREAIIYLMYACFL
jgi:hypothetical protein